jgi:serine protease Do
MKAAIFATLLSLFTATTINATFLNGAIDKTVAIKVYKLTFDTDNSRPAIEVYGGSGVFVTESGYILTCAHLFLHKPQVVTVSTADESTYLAEIVKVDPVRDLAMIKISAGKPVPFALLANPSRLEVGQTVYAIGSPLGLDFTVTRGIISYLNRTIDFMGRFIQTDAHINPGNSGGPLFTEDGLLVGINIFIIPPVSLPVNTGLAFAVPTDICLRFILEALI